ncbi:hypothetical protein [Ignavibacterium album]|uniref:hypothetical protein n=1 Tax=Ignavibacterium album TaxID=591197 RepID=UPI00059C05A5|nr:hypothetical protein [Ignavibacterium album]
MKKKLTTYVILASYLALFTANIFHFHHISLNNKLINEVSEQKEKLHTFSEHSSIQCPVQNTFNSLHKFSSLLLQNPVNVYLNDEEFKLTGFSFFQPLFFYNTFSLRAPPNLLT